jgi:hypothetical protein
MNVHVNFFIKHWIKRVGVTRRKSEEIRMKMICEKCNGTLFEIHKRQGRKELSFMCFHCTLWDSLKQK